MKNYAILGIPQGANKLSMLVIESDQIEAEKALNILINQYRCTKCSIITLYADPAFSKRIKC